jgi:putative ABC transport system permease protein
VDLRELLRESLRAISAHRLRSFLTLLGIIIGVGTLTGVIAVINGLNGYVQERVIQLAPDVWVLTKFGIIRGREEFLDALRRKDLDYDEYLKLKQRLTRSESIAAEAVGRTAVRYRDRRLGNIQVHGTSAVYGPLIRLDVVAGRYFTDAEDDTAQAVAVIGADVRDELFPHLDPIGREVLVGGRPYRVVGLLARQGRTLGQSRDAEVYVPYQAYRRQFGSRDSINILMRARGGVPGLEASVDEARGVLRALRHTSFRAPDPFGVVTAENLQQLWRQISAATFLLTLLIASVSLGVGGIVIMNIMLVAVVERTREIGVRLALGARKRDIRRQFLLEASLLSLLGGVAGVLVGVLMAFGVRNGLSFPAALTPPIAALGLALSLGVGLLAGYWPARQASNLPPVDALRSEA